MVAGGKAGVPKDLTQRLPSKAKRASCFCFGSRGINALNSVRGGPLLSSFRAVGFYWVGIFKGGKIEHYCSGPACCADKSQTRLRLVGALRKTIYKTQPVMPCHNKWSKLGPCCDVLLLGMLAHDVCAASLKRLGIKPPARVEGRDDEADEQYDAEASFAVQQGKR